LTLHGIDDLVVALRELGGILQPVKVAGTLRDVRIDERTLAPYLNWVPGRYTRNLVARDAAFELIAICWDADSRSAIHDHADSDCAFVLQAGAVRCENFQVAWRDGRENGPAEVRFTGARTLQGGQIDMRSGHLSVHRVAADGGPAITLHVYAKPIDQCMIYAENGSYATSISRYDTVPGVAP
jgi:cysteine dioxygenase